MASEHINTLMDDFASRNCCKTNERLERDNRLEYSAKTVAVDFIVSNFSSMIFISVHRRWVDSTDETNTNVRCALYIKSSNK